MRTRLVKTMEEQTKQRTQGGPGFLGFLTLLFIGLKLTEEIGWSWWWVLAPTWIPIALILLMGVAWLLMAALFELLLWRKRRANKRRAAARRSGSRFEGPS